MAKQQKHAEPATPAKGSKGKSMPVRPKGPRLWLFRLLALILVPSALLLALEFILRLAGVGYPTSFMLPIKVSGQTLLVQNDQFGWRFFGPRYARTAVPFAIEPEAAPNTVRIFVMGESAAYGDPHPEFGLARMLDAQLSLHYPSTEFEVINVAMTAINSHVIREIAADCAEADGDIWVLYIGNNEVVGPFGGGTVFGQQVPPLASIRSNLRLKATRTGQMLDAMRAGLNRKPTGDEAWGGMMMFLDQQVPADDPRMQHVYHNFRINLEDIIRCGRKAGAGIAVCSVAVNLRDCAPFASQLQSATGEPATALWNQQYKRGTDLQAMGRWADAITAYEIVESIDAHYAELHFRKGQCALELGDTKTASSEFSKARDLDTLRFRFDSRMSGIVREAIDDLNDPYVRFVDAEKTLAAESPSGIPGREFFYDHVHLTWEGNWLLAATVARQLDPLLPSSVKNDTRSPAAWPSSEQCAKRLAWTDLERFKYLNSMRSRLEDPPFTWQLNHADQIAYLEKSTKPLETASGPMGLRQSRQACESALASAPDDTDLLRRLVVLCLLSGDHDEAVKAARKETELLPHEASAWDRLATALAESGQSDEAIETFRHALSLDKNAVRIRHHLAQAYAHVGRTQDAMSQWQKVVELQPKFGTAYLCMGQQLEAQGKTAEADVLYRKAVANPINLSADLAALGKLCLNKGWYKEALKNLQAAALQSPTDAAVRYDLAATLEAMGRAKEASEQLALARSFDSNYWISKFEQGVEFGRQGQPEKAVIAFRQVVDLQPDLMEGHLNLAVALSNLNKTEEAVAEFKEVLRLDPDNAQAINYLREMERKVPRSDSN